MNKLLNSTKWLGIAAMLTGAMLMVINLIHMSTNPSSDMTDAHLIAFGLLLVGVGFTVFTAFAKQMTKSANS